MTKVVMVPTEYDIGRESGAMLSVVDRAEIVLPDRRRAQHGDGGEPALPVGGVEALADDGDLLLGEAEGRDLGIAVTQEDPVEDRVGAVVADPEVALVGLAGDKVGDGRLGDDDVRRSEERSVGKEW